jgi:hypothetical protein
MSIEWVADVQHLLGRALSVEELEMGAHMAELGLTPEAIGEVLAQPTPPAPEMETFRFVASGGDAQPIP